MTPWSVSQAQCAPGDVNIPRSTLHEVASLSFKHIQQRDSRWCVVDLVGKPRPPKTVSRRERRLTHLLPLFSAV